MAPQGFIFTPGVWIGEGKISFSSSPEFIKFYTRWQVVEEKPKQMKAVQTVEMQGVDDHVVNYFTFHHITESNFSVELQNNMIGKVTGTGIIEPATLAWEFKDQLAFEGFEVYELQENGDYFLHAEYASPDQFRTIVEGLIWKKS
jgi:hypothetical protein